MPPSAIAITVTDDLERGRASVFFRLFLALPHLLLLGMLGGVVFLMAPVVWIVALFRGQVPDSLHEFYVRLVRYSVHVYAYLYLGVQPWPPIFGEGGYAIDVTVPPPARQNRWTIFFRLILAFPAVMLAGALGGGGLSFTGTGLTYQLGVLPAVGVLGWFASLARARMPRGMRDLLAFALLYCAQAYGYLLLLTPRDPDTDPAQLGIAELPAHPVTLDVVGDDERRHRLTVFFRGLLALPHIIWLLLWAIAAVLALIGGWFAALVLGRLPAPLHRFLSARVRYQAQVYGFLYLVANPFPGFVGRNEGYPVRVGIAPAEPQNRWTIFFRGLLAIPAFVLGGALNGVAGLAAIFGWFAALVTGRMPHGLRNLLAYTLRYQSQVGSYISLLTPRYPYSGPGPCNAG
jgi:hypothetical protein